MGAAFKQMPRESFYASTKCGEADGDAVRKSLEKSLTRMNLQSVDFFHIWCVVTLDQWRKRVEGGAVAAAVKAKEEGLVSHVVVSSHLPGDELKDVLAEGPFEGVTLGYCALNFPFRQAAVDAAAEMQLGVVTMNPLGGGLIPRNPERFDFLRGPSDKNVVEAAIRFNVSNPAITCALVGFSNKEHVDQAVAAVEGFEPYPAEHVERLRREALAAYDGLCTGCGYCMPCPSGVAIPKLMDGYNHKILKTEGSVADRLRWHWSLTPEAAAACTLCGACEDKCTQHLPIRERMKEIAELAGEKKD
jgi:predicted aldo/keto reductase-like oxidoreductase